MEDVIFAGTAGRPALGRAEVTLTIDNTDGALPIDYTEVSITRRMFRSGESEYEINGDKVRLLDVQELLSDSGIGREMHVIVGQGQLDAVLSGRPEDRRAFIEEAAGVLKHRKRKEKALRKLDGMQANLDRLADLTAELRRQLKPLGRQAEVARRAADVQADLRDARLRLLADDLVQLRDALDRDVADEQAARAAARAGRGHAAGRRRRASRRWRPGWPRARRACRRRPTPGTASPSLTERFRGVAQLAAERHRHLSAAAPAAPAGRDPDQLEAEAERVAATEAELAAGLESEKARLAGAVARAHRAGDRPRRGRARLGRRGPRAGRPPRGAGQALRAGRGRAVARRPPGSPRSSACSSPPPRRPTAPRWPPTGSPSAATPSAEEQDADLALVAAHEDAVAAHAAAVPAVTELAEAERAAERDRASWQARRDALALALAPADGAAAVLEADLAGVLGRWPSSSR